MEMTHTHTHTLTSYKDQLASPLKRCQRQTGAMRGGKEMNWINGHGRDITLKGQLITLGVMAVGGLFRKTVLCLGEML